MKRTSLLVLPLLLLGGCSISPAFSSSSEGTSSSSASSSVLSSSQGESLSDSSSEEESSAEPSSQEASSPVSSQTEESSAQESLSSSSSPSSPAKPVSEEFLSFFDPSNRLGIRVSASDAVLSFISDYQHSKNSQYADVYLPVDLTVSYGGQTYVYEEAGIRMKGNTSRSEFFWDGSIFSRVHFKVSLKETFDSFEYDDGLLSAYKHDWTDDAGGRKARKDRNFLGLEKFDLKFVPRNGSCVIREIYAYESFRKADLFAPYATLVDFTLSGESDSLASTYQLIETIDKEFLKRRLSKSEAAGDLYKCTYNGMGKADFTRTDAIDKSSGERLPYGKIGVEDTWNGYHPVYDLKTNDDLGEGSDFSNMASFIQTLWSCIYGDGTSSDLENVLDVQRFLSFSAVSYLLGNADDQRYNYNNFYLYFRPSDGKAIFLPYDWDWCLGLDLGRDMSSLSPLDQWTLDGNSPSNVYLAALFGDTLPYAEGDYLDYVSAHCPQTLDTAAFAEMAGKFGETSEVSSVSAYMNAKRNRVG